jgi:hypothetical protein
MTVIMRLSRQRYFLLNKETNNFLEQQITSQRKPYHIEFVVYLADETEYINVISLLMDRVLQAIHLRIFTFFLKAYYASEIDKF